jgi:ankyrin repeat protein
MTPLGVAAFHNQGMTCDALIQAGANPNSWNLWPHAIYYAEKFIEGRPIGRTPLMIAASRGNVNAVLMLLYLGADSKLKNERGQTALDLVNDEYSNPAKELCEYLKHPEQSGPRNRK